MQKLLMVRSTKAEAHRYNGTETISEEVFVRAKGIIRALARDALPEAPAGIGQHPHSHDNQQWVPKAVVADQDESTLHGITRRCRKSLQHQPELPAWVC